MWFKAESKNALYDALDKIKTEQYGEYTNGTAYREPGWYWLEIKSIYYRGGRYDKVAVAVSADEQINNIKDKIKELSDELVTARKVVKG